MNFVSAKAPGKCILFGEHVVVYGLPAVAAAISLYTTCTIEKISSHIQLNLVNYDKNLEFSNLDQLISEIPSKFRQIGEALRIFKETFNTAINGIKITIDSELIPESGLGSSASMAVALVAALNEYYQLNLSKEEISKKAFEMEKFVHGTPSGIDNTTCTFGNLIFYQEGEHKRLICPIDINLLVSYTNIPRSTKKAIQNVRSFKNKSPEDFDGIIKIFNEVIHNAIKTIRVGELKIIGTLMNDTQDLLALLGVSNNTIKEITTIAIKKGAYGSKLTGGGLGGCVISVGPLNKLEKVSAALMKKGYKSFIATIDREGVKVESN